MIDADSRIDFDELESAGRDEEKILSLYLTVKDAESIYLYNDYSILEYFGKGKAEKLCVGTPFDKDMPKLEKYFKRNENLKDLTLTTMNLSKKSFMHLYPQPMSSS